jgi:hypothetical protein
MIALEKPAIQDRVDKIIQGFFAPEAPCSARCSVPKQARCEQYLGAVSIDRSLQTQNIVIFVIASPTQINDMKWLLWKPFKGVT